MFLLDTTAFLFALGMHIVLATTPPQLSMRPSPAIQDATLTLMCQVDPTCVTQLTFYYWNLSNPVSVGCLPQPLANTLNLSLTCDTGCPFPTECNLTMIANRGLYNGMWYCDCGSTTSINVDVNVPILRINATQSNVEMSTGIPHEISCITDCGYPNGMVWWDPSFANQTDQIMHCTNNQDVNETHSQVEVVYSSTSSFDQFKCCTTNGYGNYCAVINVTFPEAATCICTSAVSTGSVDICYGGVCLVLLVVALCRINQSSCIKKFHGFMIVHGNKIWYVAMAVFSVITLATAALLGTCLVKDTSISSQRWSTLIAIDSIAFAVFLVDVLLFAFVWKKNLVEAHGKSDVDMTQNGPNDTSFVPPDYDDAPKAAT